MKLQSRYLYYLFLIPPSAQAPLFITRSALEAFAVSNRDDVYVLQDVRDDGEEAIFYLKYVSFSFPACTCCLCLLPTFSSLPWAWLN